MQCSENKSNVLLYILLHFLRVMCGGKGRLSRFAFSIFLHCLLDCNCVLVNVLFDLVAGFYFIFCLYFKIWTFC